MKMVPLKAHEMSPSILDLTINPNVVQLKIRFSIEAILAEIDLSEVSDTNLSENDCIFQIHIQFCKRSAKFPSKSVRKTMNSS